MSNEHLNGLKTQWLEHFIALAETGGFRAAAERIGVSRQSLQRSLNQLEQQLQTPLHQIESQRFQLTPSGLIFLQQARSLSLALQRLEQRFTQLTEPLQGAVSFAWQSAACLDFIPGYLADYLRGYPQVFLHVQFEPVLSEIESALLSARLDLGLCDSLPSAPELIQVGNWRSPFVIVSAPQASCHWSVLSYAVPRSSGPHLKRPRWDEQRFPRKIVCESDSLDVLLDWALSGRAATYLPQFTVQSLLDQGRLVIVAQPPEASYKEMFLISHQTSRSKPAVSALIQRLQPLFQRSAPLSN